MSTESMRCSKPQTSTNARSKRLTAKSANIQPSKVKEEKQDNNHYGKYPVWFSLMVIAVMLGYGMYQHNTVMLLSILLLVSDGGVHSHIAESLTKLLEIWHNR